MYLSINYKTDIIGKGTFFLFCSLWFLIGFLEFIQDYISSVLNNSEFQIFESLAYKIFWILFIPFTVGLIIGLKKIESRAKPINIALCTGQILAVSIVHLIIFSFFLLGISTLIHDVDPWRLSWLIKEKFSSRLYIALSIYIVTSVVYFWLSKKEDKKTENEPSKTIPVRNGRKSVIVHVDSIKWISSDGPYLILHTSNNKRHMISNSLKNILTTLPDNFKRIHRSTIVNINKVSALKSRMNGDYDVILDDSTMLRLSRNYTKPLKGILL